jgi:uncharacterized repeat protein (TIGR02543 family)
MTALPDDDSGGGTVTPPPPPSPYSCVNHCDGGSAPPIAPGGCSCAQGCEFFGTCCRDVATACNTATYDFNIGRSKVNIISPRGATIAGDGDEHDPRYSTKFLTMNDPAVLGLSRVVFADIDSDQEVSRCAVTCNSETCSIQAYTSWDDNKADCGALGLRFPSWANVQGLTATTTYSAYACLGGTSADSIPLLTSVWIEDIDDGSETGGCQIDYAGGTCGWRLHSVQNDDVYTECKATLLKLQSGMANLGTWSTQVTTSLYTGDPLEYYKKDRKRARKEVAMSSENESVCFLTKTVMADLDSGDEKGGCEIISRDGKWTLVAQITGWEDGLDADAWCSATCASVPTTGAWPGRATAVVDALGARARLFQSGAYDRPVMFFEGFDPTDRIGSMYYMNLAGPLMQRMSALGFDIWMVDNENAGQAVALTAAEDMKAVDIAWRYQNWNALNPGKKIPAIGVSMGALAGRFGLATWEAGTYRNAGVEYAPGIASLPPVSNFIALVGPQEGGNIPTAIQTVVQDFGDYQDVGESYDALNSAAAVNMLGNRVDQSCDQIVTSWCNSPLGIGNLIGAHGDQTLKNFSELRVFGTTVNYDTIFGPATLSCPLNTDGCYKRSAVDGGSCVAGYTAAPAGVFYNDVNHRGPRGNGYPDSVTTIGMATGSWLAQGDDNFARSYDCKDAECMYQTPFIANETELGRATLIDGGHAGFLSFCDRNTTLRAFVTADDIAPGDLAERSFEDLSVDLGGSITFDIAQHFPMMFIPTYSALACPEQRTCTGAACFAACSATNASARRFTRIHAQAKNEYHGHVDAAQSALLLAYVWDGGQTATNTVDGDGYIGTTNPFYQPWMTADCNDARADVYPGAVELCDGADNDCDGIVDDGCIYRYSLAVTKTGPGTVTSNSWKIHCGDACSGTFDAGTWVTLTATPSTGYTFTGWSGACSGTGSCTVVMSQARAVTATFEIPSVQPKVWFRFDEASGVPANSGSLGGLGQTYSVAAQGVAGKVGSAIRINATYPGVNIPDQASIDNYANLTMEGWLNFTSLPISGAPYATLGKKNMSYLCRMYFSGSYGLSNVVWNTAMQGDSMAIATPALNVWHHFACTWNGTTKQMRVFWNGVEQGTAKTVTGNTTLADSTSPLTVGYGSAGEGVNGLLDDFKLWAVTRTPAEICASAQRTWNGASCQ